MLKWCAYCQQFMHEIAPYDDFSITHGLCASCEAAHEDPFANDAIERANFLGAMFRALFDAGRHEDFVSGTRIVEKAIAAGCRPVDVLMGMISPMLYEIGEEWKRGALSVEAEHRFTAFSEQLVRLVESRSHGVRPAAPRRSGGPSLFLMNAPGNRHSLAVRMLSLWLGSRGSKVRIIDDEVDRDVLMQSIVVERPKYLLISMAVPEQRDRVAELAEAVRALPQHVRPKVVVGGYPVKVGLISSIPDVELMPDISALPMA